MGSVIFLFYNVRLFFSILYILAPEYSLFLIFVHFFYIAFYILLIILYSLLFRSITMIISNFFMYFAHFSLFSKPHPHPHVFQYTQKYCRKICNLFISVRVLDERFVTQQVSIKFILSGSILFSPAIFTFHFSCFFLIP